MPYTPTVWNPGAAPGISAANLNNIETQYAQAVADCVNASGDTMTGNLNMAGSAQIIHGDTIGMKQQYYNGYQRGISSGSLYDMSNGYWSLHNSADTPGISTPTVRIHTGNKTTEFWTNLYFPAGFNFFMEHGTGNPLAIRADGSHNFIMSNTNGIYMHRAPGSEVSQINMESEHGAFGVRVIAQAGRFQIAASNASHSAAAGVLDAEWNYFKVGTKFIADLHAADAHTFITYGFNVASFDRKPFPADGDIIAFAANGLYKGSVSISGETVFYNTFVGAHGTTLKEGQERPPKFGVVCVTGETFNHEDSKPFPYVKPAAGKDDPAVYGVWTDSKAGSEEYGNPTEQVASIGLYLARVCDENGDIQPGDLLVTSSHPYEAMKADKSDLDIIRSSTLGKAVEPVNWDDVEIDETLGYKWKAIALVLYCG